MSPLVLCLMALEYMFLSPARSTVGKSPTVAIGKTVYFRSGLAKGSNLIHISVRETGDAESERVGRLSDTHYGPINTTAPIVVWSHRLPSLPFCLTSSLSQFYYGGDTG